MDLIPILNELDILFNSSFSADKGYSEGEVNQFKLKCNKILSTIDDPNSVINIIQMLFLKKVDGRSKRVFELYNSLLLETLAKKLVKKPRHLDVFFDKNEDVYKLLFSAKKEILMTCVYREPSQSLLNCLYEMILKGLQIKIIINPHTKGNFHQIMDGTGILWRVHHSLSHDFTIIDKKILILDIVEETIVIDNDNLSKKFEDQFEKLWKTEYKEPELEFRSQKIPNNKEESNNNHSNSMSLKALEIRDSSEEEKEENESKSVPRINGLSKKITKPSKKKFGTRIKENLNNCFNIGLFSCFIITIILIYHGYGDQINSAITNLMN